MNKKADNTVSRGLTARSFRIILVLLLLAELGLCIGVFIYSQTYLGNMATEVSQKRAAALASDDNLSNLMKLEQSLKEYSPLSTTIDSLYASGELPQFAAVESIKEIASRFDIPISEITLTEDTSSSSPTPVGVAPSAAPEGSTPTPETAPAQQATSGAKYIGISFQIAKSIPFENYIRFLNATELTTPKMQIDSVTMRENVSSTSITPGNVQIKVYVR